MIKIISFFILGIFLYAVNAGFLNNFLLFGAAPNLLLIVSIYLSLEEQGELYLFFSFFAGLILDFATGVFLGSFPFAFLTLSIALRFISREIIALEKNWKYLPAVLFIFQSLLLLWIYFYNMLAVRLVSAPLVLSFSELLKNFFWQYFYNLLFLYPVWKLALFPGKLEEKFFSRSK